MRKQQVNVHKVVYTDITLAEKTAANVQNIARDVLIVAAAQDVKLDSSEHFVRANVHHIVKTNIVIKKLVTVLKGVQENIILMEAPA